MYKTILAAIAALTIGVLVLNARADEQQQNQPQAPIVAVGDPAQPEPAAPEQPAPAPQKGAAGAIEQLREDTNRLSASINQKRARLAALTEQANALETGIAEQEAARTALEQALAALKQQNADLQAKFDAEKAKSDALEQGLAKVAENNAAMEAAINAVTELQERALEELEATKGSYEELLGEDESDNPTPTEPSGTDGK